MSPSLTRAEIETGLYRLGVRPGMMLEVHCSFRSLGHVEGGPPTLIEALKQAVGPTGAIVMPSFRLSPNLPLDDRDKELGLTLKIKILHEDETPSAMGVVADTFRQMPDVITGQGIFRVSAWGKDADKHSLGFQHLIEQGGHALLIGVDIYRLSSMHYVEGDLPEAIRNRFAPSLEAREIYPENEWLIEAWTPSAQPWHTIQCRAWEAGYIEKGNIGTSECMLLDVKRVTSLYRDALQTEPFALYGLA